MSSSYTEDELLALSGIQHIAFCERQWGLLVLEQQWSENLFTVEGRLMHQRVDDPFIIENRGELTISRSVPLRSYKLGLYGIADVIEWHKTEPLEGTPPGVILKDKAGYWVPSPVEYKRGKLKPDDRDEVQLCAQALCLEEMLGINIPSGFLYYGLPRRRYPVTLSSKLRERVISLANRMHELYLKKITPLPVFTPDCQSCSLNDVCLPKILHKKKTAREYINDHTAMLKEKK